MPPELAGKVHLAARPAHDLGELPDEPFDTVIINSVAQYFPSADYLAEVDPDGRRPPRPGRRDLPRRHPEPPFTQGFSDCDRATARSPHGGGGGSGDRR